MYSDFEMIINQLKKWEGVSKKILSNGTILICKVPYLAPEAWLHKIYRALDDIEIKELELMIDKKLPSDYIEFLKQANGINIFSDCLSVWGMRNSYSRKGEDAIQPYNLISLNKELIDEIPVDWLAFGSYSWDGSIMIFDLSKVSNKVFRCSSDDYEILGEWSSIWHWIKSEVERLSCLFDKNGVKYEKSAPTV